MQKEQPYYDQNGVEIEEGDLLRVFHFIHYRRRKKCYMYHVAVLQEQGDKKYWSAKEYRRTENKGHYWLRSVAHIDTRIIIGTEIISKPNWEGEDKLCDQGRHRLKTLTQPS